MKPILSTDSNVELDVIEADVMTTKVVGVATAIELADSAELLYVKVEGAKLLVVSATEGLVSKLME